jgi:hypothetical protein
VLVHIGPFVGEEECRTLPPRSQDSGDVWIVRLAVNRTGSKVLWLDGETNLIEKNNLFLEPKSTINPMNLYLLSVIASGQARTKQK